MHSGKISGERKLILQRYLSKQEAESNITSLEAKRLKNKKPWFWWNKLAKMLYQKRIGSHMCKSTRLAGYCKKNLSYTWKKLPHSGTTTVTHHCQEVKPLKANQHKYQHLLLCLLETDNQFHFIFKTLKNKLQMFNYREVTHREHFFHWWEKRLKIQGPLQVIWVLLFLSSNFW